jgi:hypothetical protein
MSRRADSVATFARERRVVFLAAGGAHNDAEIRRAVLRGLDWGALAAIAANERAVPVVWRRLDTCAGALVPNESRTRLRGLAMVSDFEQRALEERLAQSLDALGAAGVETMVLKGAALAAQVYDGFLDRPMLDVDLLVRHEDAGRARDALAKAGWTWPHDPAQEAFYADHQHLPPMHDLRGSGRTLELHTALLPRDNPFRWPVAAVWRNAVAVKVAGREALAPSIAHQLLHLCVHLAWSHQFEAGAWRTARDVAAIVSRGSIDWGHFLALARQSRAATCCYWTFRLARALANVRVPQGVESQLRPSISEAVARRLESHLLMQLTTRGAACPSLRLSRMAWTAAIRPGRSGHGPSRPWDHTGDYVPTAGEGEEAAPPRRGWGKLGAQGARLDSWRAYAAILVRGSTPLPIASR